MCDIRGVIRRFGGDPASLRLTLSARRFPFILQARAEFRIMERVKMSTKIMPVTDLRRDTSAVIRSIREEGDVVYITQHGRPAAVMLDYEQYEALVAQAEQSGWPANYFVETYGALADDPLPCPEQGEFEARETLR